MVEGNPAEGGQARCHCGRPGLGGTETDVQYLRVCIRTLRQKIEADPEQRKLILMEKGVGYRLRSND